MSNDTDIKNNIRVIDLPVIGMTCANCAKAVERTLIRKVPGVSSRRSSTLPLKRYMWNSTTSEASLDHPCGSCRKVGVYTGDSESR